MYILLGTSMNIAHKRKKPTGSNPVRYILWTFEFIYTVIATVQQLRQNYVTFIYSESPRFLNIFFTLRFYTWINAFQVFLISDGCNRNVPTNVPTSNKKPNNGYTVVPENHRLPCTANETLAKSCLNGGTCFASDIASNVKQISCQ